MSAAKAKGTAAEVAVVTFLRPTFPMVERRALTGANDRGDIAGIRKVVIEVKNHAKPSFPAFVDEAEIEKANDGADVGVAWVKRRGTTDPARWIVAMTGQQFAELLVQAGYGPTS